LGLLPQRRCGNRFADYHHIAGDGKDLTPVFRDKPMKNLILTLIIGFALGQGGCAFLGGAATGTLATGAGYEINNKRQLDKLEEDYKNEKISREEYEARKRQIEHGSIVY